MNSVAKKFYEMDALDKELSEIDPRQQHRTTYSVSLIMFIALMGVFADCQTWNQIADYAAYHKSVIDAFFKGIRKTPSHDTLRRFFCIVDPKKLEYVYRSWATRMSAKIYGEQKGRHIAIDGKTICGAISPKKLLKENPETLTVESAAQAKLHMVSAFVAGQNISLGQERVSVKHNELEAIPKLLKELSFEKGDVVTIDAMGTHSNIAQDIISSGADYLLFVKDNQKLLKQNIEMIYESWKGNKNPERISRNETTTTTHGRIVSQQCWACSEINVIKQKELWPNLHSFGRILTQRTDKTNGKQTEEVHYFISSLPYDADEILKHKRLHWAVENGLHWQLDVTFNEDSDRKRMNSAQNFSVLFKMALALLKSEPSKKSMTDRRKYLSWDPEAMKDMMHKALQFFTA